MAHDKDWDAAIKNLAAVKAMYPKGTRVLVLQPSPTWAIRPLDRGVVVNHYCRGFSPGVVVAFGAHFWEITAESLADPAGFVVAPPEAAR